VSNIDEGQGGRDRPIGPWTDRVRFGSRAGSDPFAYRPGQVVAGGGEACRAAVAELAAEATVAELGAGLHLSGVDDPIGLVDDLRGRGHQAHPNHVYFAHVSGGCDCCPPHPASASGTNGNPIYASPIYASPIYASPIYASPIYASPIYASPIYASVAVHSSARPVPRGTPTAGLIRDYRREDDPASPDVIVLDTGLAAHPFRPAALADPSPIRAATAADEDRPDENDDEQLDPAAGHGTFIAGVIDQVAPGCSITIHRVLSTFGDGDEVTIAACLDALEPEDPARTILNLSFGGYVLDHPHLLARAVRRLQRLGVVVVASAGNDGTCRPTYPAALDGVVSVGAVGPGGPAPFTNYGPWVRACAPGVDLLSAFFRDVSNTGSSDVEPDRFDGWAFWSGTSFAAPMVVGALAAAMRAAGCSAEEAVNRVIDAPALMRIPYLGTVVNVA
jgi:Subtilase family